MTRDRHDSGTLDMFFEPREEGQKGCYSLPNEPPEREPPYDADPLLTKIGDIVEQVTSARRVAAELLPAASGPAGSDENVIQLKLWPLAVRSSPNAVLRAAVFRAIAGRYRRSPVRFEPIASVRGLRKDERLEIEAMGPELCQYDLDVWLTVSQIAAEQPVGMAVQFTQTAFLRAMGREAKNAGKKERLALFESLSRLRTYTLRVTIGGTKDYVGGLLMRFTRDQVTGRYEVQLDPQLHKLFDRGWTSLDNGVRLALSGRPLAQWLFSFYATHARPFPMKVKTLHELSGSHTEDLKRFRQALCEALEQITVLDPGGNKLLPPPGLARRKMKKEAVVDFLTYWRIDKDDLVHVVRNPQYLHEAQLRIVRGETSSSSEAKTAAAAAATDEDEAGDDFFD